MRQAAQAVFTAMLVLGLAYSARADNEPPLRYRTGPFLAPLRVIRLPNSDVTKVCNKYSYRKRRAYKACAIVRPSGCWVYIAMRLPKDWYPGVLRHELGHCRGWPASHPK